MRSSPPTCRIITVGDEILNGSTIDTNSAAISRALMELGIETVAKLAVPDVPRTIARAVTDSRENILILTGGLGPTPDDRTREGLAQAFKTTLRKDPEVCRRLDAFFAKIKRKVVECNYLQALVPGGFRAIHNPFGTAPILFRRRPFIMALPGVPREVTGALPLIVMPEIRKAFRCPKLFMEEIKTSGIGESMLYDRIRHLPLEGEVKFASLPEISGVILRLSGRNRGQVTGLARKIRSLMKEHVYGRQGDTLESVIQRLMIKKRLTLAVAESCTGGLISSRLVSVARSSAYFLGGAVTYANSLKTGITGVPVRTLKRFGAVSAETAQAMARGVRKKTGADVGLSVTGIAGPTGGTREKPVGLVYVGLSTGKTDQVEQFNFFGDRQAIRERAAAAAMFLVIRTTTRT